MNTLFAHLFSLFPAPRRGFTLLISSLVAGIMLALGLAIFNIVQKELILSAAGRDSQFAFYAADSGVECALFWDYQENAFSTTSPKRPICAGAEVSDYQILLNEGTEVYTTRFAFSLGSSPSDSCASVTVIKQSNPRRTTVISSGYNTCVISNPRRLERSIRVQY